MDQALILSLVKDRLGIRTAVRDTYLAAIVQGVVGELEDQHKLTLDPTSAYHLMFCVDYAAWRYQSRDESGAMPRHLQFRLHNLLIHVGGVSS